MNLESLEVYQITMELGDDIWNLVSQWKYFDKDTIGKQLVRSADSVSANIAEGYGRYFYKETRQFLFYTRGSLLETKSWIVKAYHRNLINEHEYKIQIQKLEEPHKKLNGFLKFLREQQKKK